MPEEIIKTTVLDHPFWTVLRLHRVRASEEHTETLFIQSNSEQALQQELDALSFLYDEADRDYQIVASHKSNQMLFELRQKVASLQREVVRLNETKASASQAARSQAGSTQESGASKTHDGSEKLNSRSEVDLSPQSSGVSGKASA